MGKQYEQDRHFAGETGGWIIRIIHARSDQARPHVPL